MHINVNDACIHTYICIEREREHTLNASCSVMAEAAIELERIETLKEACEGEDARENDGGTVS